MRIAVDILGIELRLTLGRAAPEPVTHDRPSMEVDGNGQFECDGIRFPRADEVVVSRFGFATPPAGGAWSAAGGASR